MSALAGQLMILLGIAFVLVGLLVWLGFPLGRLPGDFHIQGKYGDIYFPIGTSLLVSVFLTVLLVLYAWLTRR